MIFCLFALEPPRAPTPPCSLRSSPEKGVLRFAGRAGQLAESARLDLGPAAAVMVANHPSLLLQEAEEPPPTPDGWRAEQAPNACGTGGGSAADSGGRELVGEPSLRAPSVQSSSSSGDGAQAAAAHDSRETCSQEQAGVRLQADAVAQQTGRQSGNGDDSCSQECPSGSCPEARSLGGVVRAALQAQEHPGSFSFPGSPPGAAGGAVEAGSGPGPLRHVSLRGGGAALPCAPGPEGCLILKFVGSRLLCQSEQFAAELTRHVGLCTPDSRILRQKAGGGWGWRSHGCCACSWYRKAACECDCLFDRHGRRLVSHFVGFAAASAAAPQLTPALPRCLPGCPLPVCRAPPSRSGGQPTRRHRP